MRWTSDRVTFADAVREARSDLTAKDDVLGGHALLRVVGDKLTITGRDSFTTVSSSIAVTGGENGAVCIDHRRLDDFLHHTEADDVRVSLTSTKLKVRVGTSDLELPIRWRRPDSC